MTKIAPHIQKFDGESSTAHGMKLSPLEQSILMNIQPGEGTWLSFLTRSHIIIVHVSMYTITDAEFSKAKR